MTLSLGNVPIMGEAARDWLSQGQSGKVLAAVTHTTYLLTEDQELIWLATAECPKHRRCIQWPAALPRLAVGSTFTVRSRSVALESGINLDFSASHAWEAPALSVENVIKITQLPEKLLTVIESLLTKETPVGMGILIRPILEIAKKQVCSIGLQPENILTRSAWPIIERIARDCLIHDLPAVLQHAEALVGLGEGLTPSGDDFLGGLFFARVLLLCSYPQINYLGFSNLPEWIDAAQPRTNLISFALLKDNITGHALEPLNSLGLALMTNQPVECATSAASDLIQVGHSTGWSLLAGFLVGILLAFPDELCIAPS